jgi:hypothetical protein
MIEEFPVPLQTPSLSYLEFDQPVGAFYEGDSFGGGSGGSYNELIQGPITYHVSDGSMIGSNGYILADYNRDGNYDQVWKGDGKGGWVTCTGGGFRWVKDDGPVDEMEELDRSKP